tara:strand:- start:2403 stop:3518 length:1116 start_codon:yes stop_codon:yes gene_type:complete
MISYIYPVLFHSKYKRYFRQIVSFGIIWLLFGLIYILLEYGLIGSLNEYPTTQSKYNFTNSLTYVSIGSLLIGLVQGVIEVFWLKNYFKERSFWKKILFKSTFYLLLIIFFLISLTLASNANLYKTTIFDPVVVDNVWRFMQTFSFWSVIIYSGLILDIAIFYSEIEEYLGNNAFVNYLGKYHNPRQEVRVFMFLDMKSSTSIAENLGHEKYFTLLKTYYADMTDAIIETSGEVYQYVGDEIVVSWKEKKGIKNNNCIVCFKKISEVFEKKKNVYLDQFGLVPEFKAGFHIGEVTTGEIGIIKKDIIYTGDALNTTARIQSECNRLNTRTLISEELVMKLDGSSHFSFSKIETLMLRGKKDAIQLYDVVYN